MTPIRQTRRTVLIVGVSSLALVLVAGFLVSAKSWAAYPADRANPDCSTYTGPRPEAPAEGPRIVRAYYSDPEMVVKMAERIEPWEVNQALGYVVLEADATEVLWLEALGLQVEIDELLSAQYTGAFSALPGQSSGIPGYSCYRTLTETYHTAANLAADYPHLVDVIDIGDSWEKYDPAPQPGYDLLVLKLTNAQTNQSKPKLFIMASMHPRELAPAELATRFAEYLVGKYDLDADITWLLDYNEIHLLLQANPDGRLQAETGLSWRKNTDNNYCTDTAYRGADLNRNFPFQWGCCGGSSSYECDELYRGPAPSSEPETQAIQTYLQTLYPDLRQEPLDATAPITTTGIFLDLHSYSELVLWPWGFTTSPTPNHEALETLGRKLAFFNDYTPQQAMQLYPTDGSTIDFVYGELGVAAYTFELGSSFFQDCSTFETAIVPDNLHALVYAAKTSSAPYLLPSGPDVISITTPQTTTIQGRTIQITATLDDLRYKSANGALPEETINDGEYYVDTLPGSDPGSSIPAPLLPADGNYDSAVEVTIGAIDTQGLSTGRHIVYLRGQDSRGNWGPLSAIFIHILPPTQAPEEVYFPLLISNHTP